jgi:hypothetical protein
MQFWSRRQTRLQEEVENHIAIETKENVRSEMPPEQARQAAQKKIGNTLLTIERSREIWGVLWLEYLLQDLRFALRAIRKSPGYASAVILTLALGFGSVATILAIVDSVLLRPVAIPLPDQLVLLYIVDQMGVRGELTGSESNICNETAGRSPKSRDTIRRLNPSRPPAEPAGRLWFGSRPASSACWTSRRLLVASQSTKPPGPSPSSATTSGRSASARIHMPSGP